MGVRGEVLGVRIQGVGVRGEASDGPSKWWRHDVVLRGHSYCREGEEV